MADSQIRDVLALRDHFLKRGEQPRYDGKLLSLKATVQGHDISCEVLWGARPGLVQFVAMVPLEVRPEARVAVAQELSDLNSNTVLPGFQLRLVGNEWRVFFLISAFQASDHSISATAAEGCLLACRNSIAQYLPQLAAVAEGKTLAVDTTTERAATLDAGATAAVRRLPQVGAAAALAEVEQPFFKRTRIVVARDGKRTVFVAAPASGAPRVLSGQLEQLWEVAAADAPHGLDERGTAAAYARAADRWVSEADVAGRVIESMGEAPGGPALSGVTLYPPTVFRTAAGFVVSLWAVAGRRLVYRELLVPPNGRVLRSERPIRELPAS